VEYKTTGWTLDDVRRHLSLTDGLGLGTFKLKGTRDLLGSALGAIKRVRLQATGNRGLQARSLNQESHVL
jgi:putative transposase